MQPSLPHSINCSAKLTPPSTSTLSPSLGDSILTGNLRHPPPPSPLPTICLAYRFGPFPFTNLRGWTVYDGHSPQNTHTHTLGEINHCVKKNMGPCGHFPGGLCVLCTPGLPRSVYIVLSSVPYSQHSGQTQKKKVDARHFIDTLHKTNLVTSNNDDIVQPAPLPIIPNMRTSQSLDQLRRLLPR